jgi:hypothetical protein
MINLRRGTLASDWLMAYLGRCCPLDTIGISPTTPWPFATHMPE